MTDTRGLERVAVVDNRKRKQTMSESDSTAPDPQDEAELAPVRFAMVPVSLVRCRTLTPGDKLVYTALISYASGRESRCFPRIRVLAEDVGFSDRSVRRSLANIREAGFLTVRHRVNHSNLYEFTEPDRSVSPPLTDASGPPDRDVRTPLTGASAITDQVTDQPTDQENTSSMAVATTTPRTEMLELCDHLAKRITEWRRKQGITNAEPVIGRRWETEMDLLIRRGPGGVKPEPLAPVAIRRAIDTLFTNPALCEPTSGGFCWAGNVHSPASLRRHWVKIAVDARKSRSSRAAASSREALSILKNGTTP